MKYVDKVRLCFGITLRKVRDNLVGIRLRLFHYSEKNLY